MSDWRQTGDRPDKPDRPRETDNEQVFREFAEAAAARREPGADPDDRYRRHWNTPEPDPAEAQHADRPKGRDTAGPGDPGGPGAAQLDQPGQAHPRDTGDGAESSAEPTAPQVDADPVGLSSPVTEVGENAAPELSAEGIAADQATDEATEHTEASDAGLERFDPDRANLPGTSAEQAADYLAEHSADRPWLEPATSASPYAQRVIAAIDQGGGHALERHEGHATDERLERRVTGLEDPAQLDPDKRRRHRRVQTRRPTPVTRLQRNSHRDPRPRSIRHRLRPRRRTPRRPRRPRHRPRR